MARASRVRYAVVGQGYISQAAVLPAFAHARRNSVLAALVSGDARKRRELGKKYAVPAYSYEEYDQLLASGSIDAVYVALPNSQHRDYTERAAKAGIHVLCEKPLAVTSRECEAMIRACKRHGVRLMTAYRLQFERATLSALEAARDGTIGEPRLFVSSFTMQVEKGNIRLDRDLGGGTFYDIGIYCINAARHLFRAEPLEAFAMAAGKAEVEESAIATLRFPGERLATFCVSFGADKTSEYRLVGTKGSLLADPGYELGRGLTLHLTRDGKTRKVAYAKRDQFAPELLHFSDCVLAGRDPLPGGEEGAADVRVIEALYKSIRTGKPVSLARKAAARRQPTMRHEETRPPVRRMPKLVHAAPPRG